MSKFTYESPGVYYQTADTSSNTAVGIRTDVAGFVGIAQRGPIDLPIAIESWRQFQVIFGSFTGLGYLAYTVRAFFENGGRRCWVTRVASLSPATGARRASGTLYSAAKAVDSTPYPPAPIWEVNASSPGRWGNRLKVRFIETHHGQTVTIENSAPDEAYITIANPAGFERGSLVRITDPSLTDSLVRVVSRVDHLKKRLYWGGEAAKSLIPAGATVESIEFTLLVTENGVTVSASEGISVVPIHPRYGPSVFPPAWSENSSPESWGRVETDAISHIFIRELRDGVLNNAHSRDHNWWTIVTYADIPGTATLELHGGSDGLAHLSAHDFTGKEVSADEGDDVKRFHNRGLRALGGISEVSMVAIPDIHIQALRPSAPAPSIPPARNPCLTRYKLDSTACWEASGSSTSDAETWVDDDPSHDLYDDMDLPPVFSQEDVFKVQSELIQHCEDHKDRFAILDAPYLTANAGVTGTDLIETWRSGFDTRYGAMYYPWVSVVDPAVGASQITRDIPPSGHIAGQFAQSDLRVGVHKAPANVPLEWLQDVTIHVGASAAGHLNNKGINMLKPVMGRAIRIMGARTLSHDRSWRYVSIRRLMIMITSALDAATQWAVFEPNNHSTRSRLHLVAMNYLGSLWQQGALAGASMEEAFFVKCDEVNNPPAARANGQMTIEVGVAPVHPFEFIVLRVWRTGNEIEFSESASTYVGSIHTGGR